MLDIALLGTAACCRAQSLSICLARPLQGRMLLVDCGEGTQIALRRLGWGFVNLDSIIFTHFHADHIAGLPGMLLSLGNYGRKNTLNIVGPEGIERSRTACVNCRNSLSPPVHRTTCGKQRSNPLSTWRISSLCPSLSHTLTCFGYNIQIPAPANLISNGQRHRMFL